MFSSFKLADGYVTALDLFSMKCETEHGGVEWLPVGSRRSQRQRRSAGIGPRFSLRGGPILVAESLERQ